MKLFILSAIAGIVVIASTPPANAGVVDYLGSYLLHRKYAARHAPYAAIRAPGGWIAKDPVIVTIKNGRIPMPVFATRDGKMPFKRRFLEPLAYYYYLPLVEADCALNGHPAFPGYKWKFFGGTLE